MIHIVYKAVNVELRMEFILLITNFEGKAKLQSLIPANGKKYSSYYLYYCIVAYWLT